MTVRILVMYKHYCLFTCTTCLVGQSFKERFLLRRASVRDNPERVRVSLSRLRVQRYGNFFIPASISITFLIKNFKELDKSQKYVKTSRAYLLLIIYKERLQFFRWTCSYASSRVFPVSFSKLLRAVLRVPKPASRQSRRLFTSP